jgi:glycosyltransferase involved in cell wall biosynthesis
MKIKIDGAMYSFEGITYASREEAKGLQRLGHTIMLGDTNYDSTFGDEFRTMYHPIDMKDDEYIFYKATRPEFWSYFASKYKNFVGQSVMEGDRVPKLWVNGINSKGVRALVTPSEYCKRMFIDSGVTRPIFVVNHGIDGNIYYPLNTDKQALRTEKFSRFKDKFVFFGSGAVFGLTEKDRKGVDTLIKAFKEEFGTNKNVFLLLKINTQYAENYHAAANRKFDLYNWLYQIGLRPDDNIVVINRDLTMAEMRELYSMVDCSVSASRSEGFGLMPFESLACATPIVVPHAGGFLEYAKDNTAALTVKATEDELSEIRMPYFDNTEFEKARKINPSTQMSDYQCKWFRIDIPDLRKQMRKAYENNDTLQKAALANREAFVTKFSWNNTAKKLEQIFQDVLDKKL